MKSFFTKNRNDENLGFGSAISRESKQRLINRDGSFNVRRKGLNYFASLSLYHSLLEMSWPKFFIITAIGYITTNIIFGIVYLLIGADSIAGSPAESLTDYLLSAFFFSVQTLSTIGYGGLEPGNNFANIVVTIESFIGLLGVAIITGLLFARFSKPSAKILFSDRALIGPYKDINAFFFRIVNTRENQLLEMEAELSVVLYQMKNGEKQRKFHKLDLEITKLTFFPLSWTIVHPIDDSSPLYKMTEYELNDADPEFFVFLKGVDDTFNQYVYSRSSYKVSELKFGAKFRSIINDFDSNEKLTIDISKLSEFEEVNI